MSNPAICIRAMAIDSFFVVQLDEIKPIKPWP